MIVLVGATVAHAQVDSLAVMIYRPFGSDQFTQDSGTLYTDGRLVLANAPTSGPLVLLGLSSAQFSAVNGKPLFFADQWSDTGTQYRNFRRSSESYTILGIRFYIVSAAPAVATTTITPSGRTIAATGATAQTITVASGGNWTATTGANWLTITGGASGMGNGTVAYNVAANTSGQNRIGTISIGGQSHTVTQAAGGTPPATRPANDNRSAAEVLATANPTIFRSTFNATRESGDPARIAGNSTAATVWWTWTAPASVRTTISTIGSGFDTVLGVYTAAGVSIAENDDIDYSADMKSSQVSFDAVAGQQYMIVVDGFLGGTGTVALSVGFVPRGAGASSTNARLANIATRAQVGTGVDLLIPGFVVSGTDQKTLLIRGVGPALNQFGVGGALANPTLSLFRGTTVIATNDDWSAVAYADQISTAAIATGAFPLPTGSRDSAILATLGPGAYTVQMGGVGGDTGVGLVEIYDFGAAANSARLVNIATRAQVGTGGNILIPGIVVSGTGARKLLLRAIGPSLAQFGLGGVLRDPFMVLFSGSTSIAANDDVTTNGNLADLQAAETAVGAFARQSGAFDAAVLVTLAPGAYTVQVSGVGGATGVALVEVYEVP